MFIGWWVSWRSMKLLPWPGELSEQPWIVAQCLMECENERRVIEANAGEKNLRAYEDAMSKHR